MIDPYVQYLMECCLEKDKQIEALQAALAECQAEINQYEHERQLYRDNLLSGDFYEYAKRDYRE